MNEILNIRKQRLEELYRNFDQSYIYSDPIQLVKSFENPRDQEITAVISAALAFGQVKQIVRAAREALALMDHTPFEFVARFDPQVELRRWSGFYYRMVRPSDILRLLYALKFILREHGSLKNWIYSKYDETDVHLGITWAKCVDEIKLTDKVHWKWKRTRGIGFKHLLPDPLKKNACKRVHLLLRWMVRKDSVDLGLWDQLPASKLIIPVDTHIQRISYNIGLTDRNDPSFKTAFEITENLRALDPSDPVKYDFALCRLGILDMCPKKRDVEKCRACSLYSICRL